MKTKFVFYVVGVILLTGLFSGCATTRYADTGSQLTAKPPVPFDIKIEQAVNKEFQDYYRSKRVGFTIVNDNSRLSAPFKFVGSSPDQKQIIQLIGVPEYRRSFPNISGKRVEEWIYLDQDYLVQFIHGNLVYLGSVDDLEKTLIDIGPPTDIYSYDFAGMRKDVFKYNSRYQIYTFQNDKLIVVQ